MKLLIAIPSKNRIETLQKHTWSWVKGLLNTFDVRIFVEPQDRGMYSQAFPEATIVVLSKDNMGLGYAKKKIQEYAKENYYDVIFKLDDDTSGFTDFRTKLKGSDKAQLMINVLPEILSEFEKYPNLGGVAFPYSFHLFQKEKWKPVKKMQSSYLVRTEFLCPPYPFSVFEDFAVGLGILLSHCKVLKYGLIGQEVGVKVGEGTGGLQDFDRSKLAFDDAGYLRQMYPPICFKKVDKPWKIEPDMRSIKL